MQPQKTLVWGTLHALFVAVSSLKNIKLFLVASRLSFGGYYECIDRDRPTSRQISISSVARLAAGRKTRGFVERLYENSIIVNEYVDFACLQRILLCARKGIIPT
jgi:hypothetical protein